MTASSLARFLGSLALCATAGVAQAPQLALTDLSESGAVFEFARADLGEQPVVSVGLKSAAAWDVLEFEVRGAAARSPVWFTVRGSAMPMAPVVNESGYDWRPVRVIATESDGTMLFEVRPRGERFVVRLADRPATAGDAAYYTHSRFSNYIEQIKKEPLAQVTQIGTSLQGRPLYRVIIDKPSRLDKKTVLMGVRQHGNEDASSYVLEGALDLLLGRDGLTPERDLLQKVRWVIYPLMNPDGAVANQRGNSRGFDLNREWDRNGCNSGQQPEIFMQQCDVEMLHAQYGFDVGGDHHGWGSANHGGYRYAQGQGVCFVSAPEHQEARKDTTVVTRWDPTQFAWQENGGTKGMLRAEMFLRLGFLIHTPEYNSSISTALQFRSKGQAWLRAMLDTLYAPKFTDQNGAPRATYQVPDAVYVTVDDDDENTAAGSRQTVVVQVRDVRTDDSETLMLIETGNDTGVFRNATPLPTRNSDTMVGNGVLETSRGSAIIAEYRDDDYAPDHSRARAVIVPER